MTEPGNSTSYDDLREENKKLKDELESCKKYLLFNELKTQLKDQLKDTKNYLTMNEIVTQFKQSEKNLSTLRTDIKAKDDEISKLQKRYSELEQILAQNNTNDKSSEN